MWYVAGRVYNAWWHTGQDFTFMNIRQHEFNTNDPAVIFKFNYTLYR